uniref:Uncharacterized protein n=1 Tax=Glossina palpalis gambiensis TaxID=67801 RepID=A0A1B0AN01_9MUSC
MLCAAEAAAHTLTHHHHHHYYHHHHHHHHHHHQYHYHRHSRQYCGGIFARLHIHNRAMTAAAVGVSLYEYGLSGCKPGKLCLNKQSAYVIVFNTFPGHSFVTLVIACCSLVQFLNLFIIGYAQVVANVRFSNRLSKNTSKINKKRTTATNNEL